MNLRRIAALTLLTLFALPVLAQARPEITLEQMERLFQKLRATTSLVLDGGLSWGYLFLDPQPQKLQVLGEELKSKGYSVAEPRVAPSGGLYVLSAEKVEVHTPQTLDARNKEFYALAARHGVAVYDGMTVAPAAQ